MKTIKKVVAVLVAAVMVMAMGITAFAEEAAAGVTGSLEVKVNPDNSLKGQTIQLYKLFDLTVSGQGAEAKYGYTVSQEYKEILRELLNLNANATDEEYYNAVQGKKDTLSQFAEELSKKVLEQNASPTKTSGKIEDEVTEYIFDGLEYGYYLVYQTGTSKLQSSLTSVSTLKNEVELKGSTPTIEKTADLDNVTIGQVVTYTVKGEVPDTTGYEDYIYKIQDTLSTGLDFTDQDGAAPEAGVYPVSVTVQGGTPEIVNAVLTGADNREMTIDLSAWVKSHQDRIGQSFTVTYYAKVNENAVVTEKNKASLEYGNDPQNTTTTKPSEVKTPTYPLNINKTDMESKMLAGATFRLYKKLEDANAANDKAIRVTGTAGKYIVAADQSINTMDMISAGDQITDQKYNLQLNGLAEGTYYLVETKAPDGYNKLSKPVTVTITKSVTEDVNDWTLTKDMNETLQDKILDIKNNTGTLLPETGGMGTVIFAVIAVILIAGVAISFVVSRRKEK